MCTTSTCPNINTEVDEGGVRCNGISQEQPVAARTRRLSGTVVRDLMPNIENCQDGELTNADPHTVKSNCTRAVRLTVKQLAEIYCKVPSDRTQQEAESLKAYAHMIPSAENYLKSKQEKELLKQRLLEVEESHESIRAKTAILAKLIRESRHAVIYTGAGISTSASIPDYRGPNGIWTQIKKTGSFSLTKVQDLSRAEPTFTHMAIKELARRRIIKHVVSQNCDGLHLRSGIAQSNLSEIHGNMYIEVCPTCERQYFREADVTQQTCRFRHKTGRKCHTCSEPNNNLIDTIVLYGERSRTKWPMNWERASKAASNADLIICMGSSLKTLRRYGCLWPATLTRKSKSETKLVIINLQHTSKDKNAFMKINGKCDIVMENVMQQLGISVPSYEWLFDPLVRLAVPFTIDELAKLKRNLIFESRRYESSLDRSLTSPSQDDSSQSPISKLQVKRSRSEENRTSPSLFVSELTDDPDRKRLRMRIRAVNVGAAGLNEDNLFASEKRESGVAKDEPIVVKQEFEEHDVENLAQIDVKQPHRHHVEYSPPGWLGKGLGVPRSSSYRRKRHGNKGRKRTIMVSTEPATSKEPQDLLPASAIPTDILPQEA